MTMIVSNSSNGSNSKTSLMDSPFKLLAGQVTINEETLRDGEQTAGVTFLKQDKVAIAQLLAQALPGAILNAGYPPISRAEWEAVNAVAQATEGAQVECAGRCTREDFKLCYTAVSPAQFPRVSFWFPSSPLMLEFTEKSSPQRARRTRREKLQRKTLRSPRTPRLICQLILLCSSCLHATLLMLPYESSFG
jgi:hypothetical protein